MKISAASEVLLLSSLLRYAVGYAPNPADLIKNVFQDGTISQQQGNGHFVDPSHVYQQPSPGISSPQEAASLDGRIRELEQKLGDMSQLLRSNQGDASLEERVRLLEAKLSAMSQILISNGPFSAPPPPRASPSVIRPKPDGSHLRVDSRQTHAPSADTAFRGHSQVAEARGVSVSWDKKTPEPRTSTRVAPTDFCSPTRPADVPSANGAHPRSHTTAPTDPRVQEEMDNCRRMKPGELMKELEQLGISTETLYEWPDFVKAVAEARVFGGKTRQNGARSNQVRPNETRVNRADVNDVHFSEPLHSVHTVHEKNGANQMEYDYVEYKDAELVTDDSEGPHTHVSHTGGKAMSCQKGHVVGGKKETPFVGAAGGWNPIVIAKVKEVMSNPESFVKYESDPDVIQLLREVRGYM